MTPPSPGRSRRRMPAEWEPCQCVWLAWPHNAETWPGRFSEIPAAFAKFVATVAESTPVQLLATGEHATTANRWIGNLSNVVVHDIPTNDCWIRDYGPTFVIQDDQEIAAALWRFNAWGGKYHPYDADADAGRRIAAAAKIPTLAGGLTLEGGNLETDGAGRLMLVRDCIVDPNRNPGLLQDDVTAKLRDILGVEEVIWLTGGGPAGDDTDGHIDQIARFVDRDNIVVAVADSGDPNHLPLEANFRQLKEWADEKGVSVHRLKVPPQRSIDGNPVPQSYCNFLMLGPDRVLVPTFASPRDDIAAMDLLRQLRPGADIIGVPCEEIAWGLGALHCASCQQPAVPDPLK